MRVLLLDLEGTIYTREGVLPGALEAVAALRERCDAVRFLTNTDSQATDALHASLVERCLNLSIDELFTPVRAASELVSAADGTAFALVTDAVRAQLGQRIGLTDDPDAATHVLVGDCRPSLSYALLDAAFSAVTSGCPLVALQRGRFFLSAGARHLDTGAIVAALEYAAGVSAEVVGKPSPSFVRLALASLGPDAAGDVWVVGDDATSDIAMGHAFGATTVQVRTGKFTQQPEASTGATHTIDSLADLPALLDASTAAGSTER